ncbi:MAG: cupin domain-containing protein [Crocinitomicaceae bacterium]|nr:cupin domain-containing protein [Crocinitomicaceae bacterium]MBK8924905.1 cupin domain-containing protein [Crocinitomicaceae bacterium]
MIKRLCFSICFIALIAAVAQIDPNLKNHRPPDDYDNIHVEKISGDSNQTAFIIWVKNEVALHKHEWHTENVYILDGKGEFTMNDEKFIVQKGDYFNIPEGTPHALKVLSSTPVKVLSIQSPFFDGTDRILISQP